MAEPTKNQGEPKKTADDDTVLIRLKTGRLLLGRKKVDEHVNGDAILEDIYLEAGKTARVPRRWAEKLAKRQIESYPSNGSPGTFGLVPAMVLDSPIEIIETAAA